MQIQTAKPLNVVSKTIEATLATVSGDVGDLPEQLYADFVRQQFEPAGPMVFIYSGVDGNPHTKIQLQIALPVNASDAAKYNGPFKQHSTPSFNHVDSLYTGTVADMGTKGYEPIMTRISKAALQTNGECREVYENWMGPQSGDNEIRLQIGIAA